MQYDAGKCIGSRFVISRSAVRVCAPAPLENQSATTLGYYAIGRLISVADALGDTTTYTYNPIDRLTEVRDALGGTMITSEMQMGVSKRAISAESIFDHLSENTKTAPWRCVGKLGRAAYTDNYVQLSEVLNVLEKNGSAPPKLKAELVRHYQLNLPTRTANSQKHAAHASAGYPGLGRAVGDEIVQLGEDHNGIQRSWRFVEITDQSFRWIGEVSWGKGTAWALELEMRAIRRTWQRRSCRRLTQTAGIAD